MNSFNFAYSNTTENCFKYDNKYFLTNNSNFNDYDDSTCSEKEKSDKKLFFYLQMKDDYKIVIFFLFLLILLWILFIPIY